MLRSMMQLRGALSLLALVAVFATAGCGSETSDPSCLNGVLCEGKCIDPGTDRNHCGATGDCAGANAGTACSAGYVCDGSGVCAQSCPTGQLACDGICVNPSTDVHHCGATGSCAAAEAGANCGDLGECSGGTCVACDWDPLALTYPIAVHPANYFGGIDFDANCDMLVTGGLQSPLTLYRISRADGAVTGISTGFTGATAMTGVAWSRKDGVIYVATDTGARALWSVPLAGGAPTNLFPIPSVVNDIAIAPAGFGAYEGQVFHVGTSGEVRAIDPIGLSSSVVGTTSGGLSDLAFAQDGSVLYVANYTNGTIQTMTPAGVFATYASGLTSVDGIALAPTATRIYAANTAGGNKISTVTIPGAAVSTLGTVSLDGGYYTTGMLVDGSGDVFVLSTAAGWASIVHVP